MNDFERIVYALDGLTMTKPEFYGLYHVLWLCATILTCTLVFAFAKNVSARAVDITLVVWGAALILLEVVKQVLCSFHSDGETVKWFYEWHAFPLQFCSTPLFVALPAGLLKKGRIKNALLSFLAAFAIIGGIAAMVYPANMFSQSVFINVHTMLWHSSMVTVCFMLLATKTVVPDKRTFLGGFTVFIAFVAVALVLNAAIGGHMGIRGFNLFYISAYEVVNVPIVRLAYEKLPYPLIPILYVILLSLAAVLILMITYAADKRAAKKNEERVGDAQA